jgi:hypothetical protein
MANYKYQKAPLNMRPMTTPPVKQYILPFSTVQDPAKATFSADDELAAVYVLAEMDRQTGSGLIGKSKPEQLVSVAKVGYPVWVFPMGKTVYFLDGLEKQNYIFSFFDFALESFFAELEKNLNLVEPYMDFLLKNIDFFAQNKTERKILLPSLISNKDFHWQFNLFRREAKENTVQNQITPLGQTVLPSTAKQIGDLQIYLKNQIEKTQSSIQKIMQVTGDFSGQIDFEAGAAKDESAAKIKALEELIKPKVAKLEKTHKSQSMLTAKNFRKQVAVLRKQKTKLRNAHLVSQKKVKRFERAKVKAEKKHLKSEMQWREKLGLAKKQLEETQSKLGQVERAIADLGMQKVGVLDRLKKQLDSDVDRLRQPIRDLQAAYLAKLTDYNHKKTSLEQLTKTVIDELTQTAGQLEKDTANLNMLGLLDDGSWRQTLLYVPFYTAYYQNGSRRLKVFLPSTVGAPDFSAKIKVAFGKPKIGELFDVRFRAVGELGGALERLGENSWVEQFLREGNLLCSQVNLEAIQGGLRRLAEAGWLSQREHEFYAAKLRELSC